MAIVVSPVWSSIRGSIAGTTYLTTPSGQIIARQRTVPVNAPSPYRTLIKSALIQAVSEWESLTVAQKTAWNTWALANPPGSGREQMIAAQAFQHYGDNLAPINWPVIAAGVIFAPTFPNHPSFTFSSAPFTAAADTGISVKVKNTSPYPVAVMVQLSTGMSTSRNYWKGPWDPAQTVGDTIAAAGTKTFDLGGLNVGLKYFSRARVLSTGTVAPYIGRLVSVALITSSVAVTNP